MAQGKQQLKLERNPHIRYKANCDTDGQVSISWTTKMTGCISQASALVAGKLLSEILQWLLEKKPI